jgi:hypothetical protein
MEAEAKLDALMDEILGPEEQVPEWIEKQPS